MVVTFQEEIGTYWSEDSGTIETPEWTHVEIIGDRIVVTYPEEVIVYDPHGVEQGYPVYTTESITTTIGGSHIVVRFDQEMEVYNLNGEMEADTEVDDQAPLLVRATDEQVIEIYGGEDEDYVRVYYLNDDSWGYDIDIDSDWTDAEVVDGLFFLIYADKTWVYEIIEDRLYYQEEYPPIHDVIPLWNTAQ